MAQEQVKQLKQKLQSYQIEFDNYKIQCKQLQQFLQNQSSKKEEEIRQLKEEAIKKEKQFALTKTEISQLQSENKNLKARIKQLQQGSSKTQVAQAPSQSSATGMNQQVKLIMIDLEQYKRKCLSFEKQVKDLEQKIKQNFGRHSEQVRELKQQIKQKDKKIKDNLIQIENLKQLKSQNKQKQTSNKSTNLQITIQRSKKVSSYQKQQQLSQIKSLCDLKDQQLASANEKMMKFVNKIKNYQNRIRQLQLQILESKQKGEFVTYDKNHSKSKSKEKNNINISENDDQQEQQPDRVRKNQKNNNSINALILTKKYYISPFMQFQGKNTIKLYKTQKNGRIDKSLGSLKYKLNSITYDSQLLITKTVQNIRNNFKTGVKSRVVIFGTKRGNKKELLCSMIRKIKDQLIQTLMNEKNQSKRCLTYLQLEQQYVKNLQLKEEESQNIITALQRICELGNQIPKTPKKYEKIQSKLRQDFMGEVIYFRFEFKHIFLQIVTSNFTDVQIKQSLGLINALDSIAYSKIPEFNHDHKVNLLIILTINPIVGLYQQCKSTLALVNCKNKQLPKNSVFDWRESPQKFFTLSSSPRKQSLSKREKQQQNYKIAKLCQQIQFYKSRFHELIGQLKIILNTNGQTSYLKKTPVILSFEKILKFAQSTLNQSQSQHFSLLKSPLRVNDFYQK